MARPRILGAWIVAFALPLIAIACIDGPIVTPDSADASDGAESGLAPLDAGIETDAATTASTGDSSSTLDTGMSVMTAAPTLTPPSGTYSAPQCVTLASTTPNSVIHYTADGSTPSSSSQTYEHPIGIWSSKTLRTIAYAPGFGPSEAATGIYELNFPAENTSPVSFSPTSGQYSGPIDVVLATTSIPFVICYTLNGPNPTCHGQGAPLDDSCTPPPGAAPNCTGVAITYQPSTPILIAPPPTANTSVVVRAIACGRFGYASSDVTSATYTFQ